MSHSHLKYTLTITIYGYIIIYTIYGQNQKKGPPGIEKAAQGCAEAAFLIG
jgi:hypothetical protein